MKSKKVIGIIFLVFTIIVWGITFLATKALLVDFKPMEIMLFRFGLSFVGMFLLYPKIFKWQGWKVELLCLLASIAGITAYQSLENVAILYANGSFVSIIISTASFFTAIFSRIILKNKGIRINYYIGFVISLVGIILISLNGTEKLNIKPLGVFISIACAVLWGLYSVLVDLIGKYKLNLVQTTRRIMLDAFILIVPLFFITGGKFEIARFAKIENVVWIVFLGVLASAICFYTWNYCVSALGTVTTSYGVLVQPIVTIVVGAIWFEEKFTWVSCIGVSLILIGLYIALFIKKKMKEVNESELEVVIND